MSIFDGLSGLMTGVFGGSVLHMPQSGPARTVQAIFREPPIEIIGDDDHAVLDVAPVLRVPAPVADGIAVGDLVQPENGLIYRVVNRQPGNGPAIDAFTTFALEHEA